MSKKIIFVKVLIAVAVLTGIFFFVRHEIKLQKSVAEEKRRLDIIEDFLIKSFPNQVTSYLNPPK